MPITLENVEFTYMAKTPYERKALQGVSLRWVDIEKEETIKQDK